MRFSAVIPLYNKEPYIEKSLKSVICQTFRDFELIVVNDGSTDSSEEIAEKTLATSNIDYKIINKENGGVSSARNLGIEKAKGEYVCFLDADDWWEPNFLERIDWLIRNYPDAGLYCSNYYYVHNGKSVVKLDISTGYFNYCREYARTLCMSATSSSACVKKAILVKFGGFKTNLKLGEDFDLWVRIALNYGTSIVNEPLASYYNDVPVNIRATHHLFEPQSHILWNLRDLEQIETSNQDYKRLIDRLRVYGLLPYYLNKKYHDIALNELNKVNWSLISDKEKRPYRKPIWIIKTERNFFRMSAIVKSIFLTIVR